MAPSPLPRTLAVAFTASLTLLSLVATPAAAGANICSYPPTGGSPVPMAGGGAVPGPWTGAFGPSPMCPTGAYTSSAATCTGYGVGVAGAYCDTAFTPGATPPGPLHTVCTVYPSAGVTLTSLGVGWDLSGPMGVPDGNLDMFDYMGPPTGASVSTMPGATGEMTVKIYPPPFKTGVTYQLIVYVGATSALPGGVGAPLPVACQ